MLFNVIYCCDCRTACCEHWVNNNDLTLVYRLREFAVVFVRLMGNRVTIKSDVTYSCRRNESENAADHTKTGSKNWHNSEFFA